MGVTIRFKSSPIRYVPFTFPFSLPFFLYSCVSSVQQFSLSSTQPLSVFYFAHFAFIYVPFFFLAHQSTQGSWLVPQSSLAADVAVVCERSVLSKQTHWAICYSTLHQAGSSEESAHHFNQPRQHTMNF